MQILGKRNKVLLITLAIVMLVAIGVSFAMWDTLSVVKATTGNVVYSTAQVGDIIQYGSYYQTGLKDEKTGEYEKTPIEWIVVDKDERTGQLTLMSKYILACGSYFGNYYAVNNDYYWYYSTSKSEVGGVPYNQAYVDSTARAFLNNLERLDLGGDKFDAISGYIQGAINSTIDKTANGVFTQGTGLLSSVGFSNQRYITNFDTNTAPDLKGKPGIYELPNEVINQKSDFYFQRPIKSDEYRERPMTRGFLDEAFTEEQKSMIVPKVIAGYTGHRWPDDESDISSKSSVEGAVDKVWLPSVTELNIDNGLDWKNDKDDAWTASTDKSSSKVFEYFKNFASYKNPFSGLLNSTLSTALVSSRTQIAMNGKAGNYSIPVYEKGTSTPNTKINDKANTSNHYWTCSPSSLWYHSVRAVDNLGRFNHFRTHYSNTGIRPCIILKY